MINNSLNEKVFDAMLEVACGDIMAERIAAIDTIATTHMFSPAFEKRMKGITNKYIRKIRRKKTQKALGRVAIVFLVLMTIGFTLTITVSAIRKQVLNTIMEIGDEYFGFSFKEDNVKSKATEKPSYIPDGYSEDSSQVNSAKTMIVYTNSENNMIWFLKYPKDEGINFKIDNKNSKPAYEASVNGITLTVYESSVEEYPSYVIWETDDYFFELSGEIVADELLKMAESVITE